MRLVALEEHFLSPSLIEERFAPEKRNLAWLTPRLRAELSDLGTNRLRDMDAGGISQQVLSASMPGADLLDGDSGVDFAVKMNNRLAEAVRAYPHRFAGFAHLPMRQPPAAADELERTVRDLGFRGAMINGLTDGRFLDDSRFEPILSRAARLGVPIYIHPNLPPEAVYEAYYAGLPGMASPLLASGIFGWHSEAAIHVFRLALSGAFERHPDLTVIVGHMGEMLPFMLARADAVLIGTAGFTERISKLIVDRVYITTSGFFSIPPFLTALTTFGVDRIMFSVDYPFSSNLTGKSLMDVLPVSASDRQKIAHGNADRLLKLPALTGK
jgi:predicted TIM-barrel fold metal-dependent hydrolase